jgi:hypothetical protein
VKTGIQTPKGKSWIPAGVYPDENRGRNDNLKENDLTGGIFKKLKLFEK